MKVARIRTTVTSTVLAAAVVTALVSAPTSAGAAGPDSTTAEVIDVVETAGFADIDPAALRATDPLTSVSLTPTLAISLPGVASAATDGATTINGTAADGAVVVARTGGFGVVTDDRGQLEYRYPVVAASGTTLVPATDGGLDEVSSTGTVVGHVDPAYAVDSTGRRLPASYGYDTATRELVVRADTTAAQGLVFVDPSWKCYAVAGAYGLGALVVIAGWIFVTRGVGVSWMSWALRTYYRVTPGAADAIARACAS